MSTPTEPRVLITGAHGTLGSALAQAYAKQGFSLLLACRRSQEHPLAAQAQMVEWDGLADDWSGLEQALAESLPTLIIHCVGSLHGPDLQVEKSISQLDAHAMQHSFALNCLAFARLAALIRPKIKRQQAITLATLSAKVGSIGDNQLGGWYSYRASKAALNMVVKSLAVELARLNSDNRVLALHPGTTMGPLTAPFASNIHPDHYYSPELSAQRLQTVLARAQQYESGSFLHWDGSRLPW